MTSCVLLLRPGHYLNSPAITVCRSQLHVLAVAESGPLDEAALAALRPDFVFSFLNERILRGPLLDLPGINFHPAPPRYPGRGGASYALFDGAAEYGATAHRIERVVDGGPIVAVRRFPISTNDTCESLYVKAELATIDLFCEVADVVAKTGKAPPPNGELWERPAITRAEFENWLLLDLSDPDVLLRKVKAARHSLFPGPFIDLGGVRFALESSDSRAAGLDRKEPS